MLRWAVLGVVTEQEPIDLNGLNLWDFQWQLVDSDPVMLPHPHYSSQMHKWHVYEIEGAMRSIRFAACELSNGVWGFRVPVQN